MTTDPTTPTKEIIDGLRRAASNLRIHIGFGPSVSEITGQSACDQVAAMLQSLSDREKAKPVESGDLTSTFYVGFLDGYLEDESDEALRAWSMVKSQLSTAIQERDAARERALEEAAVEADSEKDWKTGHFLAGALSVAMDIRRLKSQSPAAQDGYENIDWAQWEKDKGLS